MVMYGLMLIHGQNDDEKDFAEWLMSLARSLHEEDEVVKDNELRRVEYLSSFNSDLLPSFLYAFTERQFGESAAREDPRARIEPCASHQRERGTVGRRNEIYDRR